MRIDHSGSFQSSRSARAFGLREPVKCGECFPLLAAYVRAIGDRGTNVAFRLLLFIPLCSESAVVGWVAQSEDYGG